MKGYFCSDTVFNLSNKVLTEGLDFAPIQRKVNEPELRQDFENFCRCMRIKWHFRNESSDNFSEIPAFSPKSSWKPPLGHPNSKSSSAAVRTGLRPVKAHITLVHFDYNSKSSPAAVSTGLQPDKAHVTLVRFDYNSKTSSTAVRTGLWHLIAHATLVRFDYNSKPSSAAVGTGLRPVKVHVTLVRFTYNSKTSSAAVRTGLQPVKAHVTCHM